jgi:hypothetical protein
MEMWPPQQEIKTLPERRTSSQSVSNQGQADRERPSTSDSEKRTVSCAGYNPTPFGCLFPKCN